VKLFILMLLMIPAIARPADFGMEVHGHAWHRDAGPFNERNPGLGLFARQGTLYGHVGGYKNSFSKPSYYVAAEWLPIESRYIDAGIGGGGATGYRGFQSDHDIAPGAYIPIHVKIPELSKDLFLAIRTVPPLKYHGKAITNGLTTASLGWQWK
jgi:hypothetical protein